VILGGHGWRPELEASLEGVESDEGGAQMWGNRPGRVGGSEKGGQSGAGEGDGWELIYV